MRPAMVHSSILEDRRQAGHDRFDEVWDGVLHMVPYPTPRHQRIVLDLLGALAPIARRRGLLHFAEVGVYQPASSGHRNYRGPDCVVVDRSHVSERGIEGNAHLVVEVISPDDESRKKLPFYAGIGVRDIWLIDPAKRSIEVLVCEAGVPVAIGPVDGFTPSPALGLSVSIAGAELRIDDGEDRYAIDLAPAF